MSNEILQGFITWPSRLSVRVCASRAMFAAQFSSRGAVLASTRGHWTVPFGTMDTHFQNVKCLL